MPFCAFRGKAWCISLKKKIKQINPSNGIIGEIKVPGDKSISHRAVMLCSLADGVSSVSGIQTGADVLATVEIMRKLGVQIDIISETEFKIHGKGLYGLRAPTAPLNAKNSGTTMRLLSGILAWQNFDSVIIGDSSLSKRPMDRIIRPLSQMGADIRSENGALEISGRILSGIKHESLVASAQVKSAILLAGLNAKGKTTIHEPIKTRDHTEVMLKQLGADISVKGNTITIIPKSALTLTNINIPGDFSSAAFFIVAALITPNSHIIIKNVGISHERTGLLNVLKQMGADIKITPINSQDGEPIANIEAKSSLLIAASIDKRIVGNMIDELPIFAVAAVFACGTSIVKDAEELKVKESNRISAMASELKKLGADIKETNDGFIINGNNGERLKGGSVTSHGDHRVAMSLAISGLTSEEGITIEGFECVNVSYPKFGETLILS